MRTDRSKSKRSRRSGNTSKLDRIEHSLKRIITIRMIMKTKTSKGKTSKRSKNTSNSIFSSKQRRG